MQVYSHEKTLPFLVSLLDLPVSPNERLNLDIIAEAIWTINEICFEPGMTQKLFELHSFDQVVTGFLLRHYLEDV